MDPDCKVLGLAAWLSRTIDELWFDIAAEAELGEQRSAREAAKRARHQRLAQGEVAGRFSLRRWLPGYVAYQDAFLEPDLNPQQNLAQHPRWVKAAMMAALGGAICLLLLKGPAVVCQLNWCKQVLRGAGVSLLQRWQRPAARAVVAQRFSETTERMVRAYEHKLLRAVQHVVVQQQIANPDGAPVWQALLDTWNS